MKREKSDKNKKYTQSLCILILLFSSCILGFFCGVSLKKDPQRTQNVLRSNQKILSFRHKLSDLKNSKINTIVACNPLKIKYKKYHDDTEKISASYNGIINRAKEVKLSVSESKIC